MDQMSLSNHTYQNLSLGVDLASKHSIDQMIKEKAASLSKFSEELDKADQNSKAQTTREMANDIDPKVKKAAKELEAVFLAEMLSPMFNGLKVDPLFGGGHSEKIYRGMMVQEYGKSLAEAGGIGLQDYISEQIQSYQKGAK